VKGIRYIVDNKGRRTAVILDLKIHAELWEDICDVFVAKKRLKEPRVPLAEVVAGLPKARKVP
jgi:hypothetical protein